MGEAKSRLARMLRRYRFCVYCGGAVEATSIDHCPPIALFDNRQRPSGLEFPACGPCHEGTRNLDLVVSVLSRFLSEVETPANRRDIERGIRGLVNNHADIARLFDTRAAERTTVVGQEAFAVRIRDPARISRIMNAFAARLGLALYHDETGTAAPPEMKIAARWYSNAELFAGDYPEELIRAIGLPRTLAMGRWSVADQFRYWAASAAPDAFGMFAAFRTSFAVLAILRLDDPEIPEGASPLRPGFLRGFTV